MVTMGELSIRSKCLISSVNEWMNVENREHHGSLYSPAKKVERKEKVQAPYRTKKKHVSY